MSDSGKRHVSDAHPVALGRGVLERLRALCLRRLRIAIEAYGNCRLGELDGRDVQHVAPEHESLALALDRIRGVTRRVTMRSNAANSGNDRRTGLEGLELLRVDVRLYRRHRNLKASL